MIATNEGNSYPTLMRQLADTPWDLLILSLPSDLPDSAVVRNHLGKPHLNLRGSTGLHSGLGVG